MLPGQFFLQVFYPAAGYLDNPAAFYTNEVMMMVMAVFILEPPESISEIDLGGQAGITYYSHCSIYSSEPDVEILFSESAVNIVNSRMVFYLYKSSQDLLTLSAVKQSLCFQILPENSFSRFHISALAAD